ncbi:hypothetical protein KAZ93_00855 [Patescibacteria group bacterium]|nr:hypothetical protein [Patescibacteria group bacterium]
MIATIRQSSTKQEAKDSLMAKFDFSDPQAEHILMMRLQSLVGLELQKIIEEIEEKQALIKRLEEIIANPVVRDNVVREEILDIKARFGDKRRTILVGDETGDLKKSLKAFDNEADQVKEDVIVWLSDQYELRVLYQSRLNIIPDNTINLVYTHNQDHMIVITDRGELVVQRLKDFGSFQYNSTPVNFIQHFGLKGKIVFANTLHAPFDHLFLITNDNNIKKIDKNLVLSFKKFPTTIMNLPGKNEAILTVIPASDTDKIGVVTDKAAFLMFPAADLRPMGKTA